MSTTPPPLPSGGQRLHPLSWLFLSAGTVRQFLLPLVGVLVFGRRMAGQSALLETLLPLLAAVLVVGSALLAQLAFRYVIGPTQLSVRSGVFERQWREIPFTRIHNVSVRQTLVHRLLGVAELRLESAGSPKPEAEMKVLPLARALALEQLVRQSGSPAGLPAAAPPADAVAGTAAAAAPSAPPPGSDGVALLRLSAGDLVRMGLLSNRGMIVVLAALGALRKLLPEDSVSGLAREQARAWFQTAPGQDLLQLPPATWAALGLVLVLAALVLTRLLSVLLAFVQYGGFELRRQGNRLTQERGLLARQRASAGCGRIQAWTVRQPLLYRWAGQCRIRVDIAAGGPGREEEAGFRDLVPILPVARRDALLRELAPELGWPLAGWQPVGRRHAWRRMLPPLLLLPAACAAGHLLLDARAWAGLLVLPLLLWNAWRAAGFAAWHLDAGSVGLRGGAWGRWWRVAALSKVQAVSLRRSPLDRLCGTATLRLDTAGRGNGQPVLDLRYLPADRAQVLLETLCARLSRPKGVTAAYQPAGPQ